MRPTLNCTGLHKRKCALCWAGQSSPKWMVLKEEGRKLTAKKKQLYGEYQKARRDMQEIVTIKANIDTLMGYTEPGRKQEKER